MPNAADTALILKYVGDDSSHLNIALAVHDAFDEIRARIIRKFVLQLKNDIATQLGSLSDNWLVDLNTAEDWTRQRDNRLQIRERGWIAECYVGLRHDSWGPNRLWIGIWGLTPHPIQRNNLLVKFPDWARSQSELLWRWLSNEFAGDRRMNNWTDTAAIRAMHEGINVEYYQRIRDRLVETARSADQVLSIDPS
jgi:hypothetical protein